MLKVIILQLHIILLLLIAMAGTAQTTLFVNHAATGANNGTTWQNAFSDLQNALANAQFGDQIWVAQGTYKPTADTTRNIAFNIPYGVQLYGGFSGTESSLAERALGNVATVLSGNIGDLQDSTDNSYHVLTMFGADSTNILDGLHIAYGFAVATSSFSDLSFGGGILMLPDDEKVMFNPILRNCNFYNNVAQNGGALAGRVSSQYAMSPIFEQCTFEYNRSTWGGRGGAINIDQLAETPPSIAFNGCRFLYNWGFEGGAVLLNNIGGNLLFRNCHFERDSAEDVGSGIFVPSFSHAFNFIIDSCTFQANHAHGENAIAFLLELNNTMLPTDSAYISITNSHFEQNKNINTTAACIGVLDYYNKLSLVVNKCRFYNNESGSGGDAIFCTVAGDGYANIRVCHSIFIKNKNADSSGSYGAIYLRCDDSYTEIKALLYNNIFTNNDGALNILPASFAPSSVALDVYNCTFYNNGRFPFWKVSLDNFDSTYFVSMRFSNCIIWENDNPLEHIFFNATYNYHLHNFQLRHCLLSTPSATLPSTQENIGDEGMIFQQYPYFLDTLNYDYRLVRCSPAVNVGSNLFVDSLGILTDIIGNSRIASTVVDMGAYEQTATSFIFFDTIQHASAATANDGAITIDSLDFAAPPYTYFWSNGATTATNDELLPGTYTVTVTDALDCTDTKQFVVDFHLSSASPVAVTPITAQPNPAHNTLYISNLTKPNVAYQISNALGQVVQQDKMQSNNTISVAALAKGIYFLNIEGHAPVKVVKE